MVKAATEVMHDVIYAAVVDAIVALKAASGGLPNTLLRDIGAIHANVTFADLPKDVQAAITAATRSAFNRLQREGYAVANASAAQSRPAAPPRHDVGARPPRRAGAPSRPGGGPAGAKPEGTGPRRPGGSGPEGRGPRGPGGPKPRGPRPPRSR